VLHFAYQYASWLFNDAPILSSVWTDMVEREKNGGAGD
jgi:hypothetical protein